MGGRAAHRKRRDKQPAVPNVTKEQILRLVQGAQNRGAGLQSILEEYEATPQVRRQIKDILTQLVKEGRLERHKGSRYQAPVRNLIEGTILLHRDGYGFVIPKEKVQGVESDIFIPSALVGSAMNGDKVEVDITLRKPGGRAEGRVVNVTRRARDTIVGQLRFDGRVFFVAPSDEKLPDKIIITGVEEPSGNKEAAERRSSEIRPVGPTLRADVSEHKDKIVEVEITRFPTQSNWPAGKIVNVIGFLDDPNVETQVIIKKFGLSTGFPQEVEQEAAQLPDALTEPDFAGRDDFRNRRTITVDPTTARDFDDAIDVETLKDGSFQLAVHIADVSHFVRLDSAMDVEARCRGCSVYFPDRVIPMLPEKVSNHLCSLNPRTDRLAMSVVMHISHEGQVLDYSFHNSVIHSKERMTYDDVQKIIDGDNELGTRYAHVVPDIAKIDSLARVLRRRREEIGAIDFDLPEPVLTYDDEGDVTGITKAVRHFSHRIVEEFMVLANEVVAQHLENLDIPSIYRVHEEPDPVKVRDFTEIVAGFGLKFRPKRAAPIEFQKFIASIAGRPEERMLSYLMLRSFKQAMYSSENSGHFGLAADAYTHFTSPIRRYPDLVVHRILKSVIARKRSPYASTAQLEAIASESSERERVADQAERELFDWKKMIFLEKHLGEVFEAIVISARKDGYSIELTEHFIEGFIPAVELPKRQLHPGDRLKVQVVRVDKLLRRAHFSSPEHDHRKSTGRRRE